MIDSQVPAWLARRSVFDDNGVTQGVQTGFNMGIQLREQGRIDRAMQMKDEAHRLAMEEKERAAEGAIEVSKVLAKMGSSGGYSDPALQAEFWDTVSRNPKFMMSPVFKDIMDTMQYAEQAKERSLLLKQRYGSMADIEKEKQLGRVDLWEKRLDGLLQMEGLKQEGRQELEAMRGEIGAFRDILRGGVASDLEDKRQAGRVGLEQERQSGRVELQFMRDEASMDRLRQSLEGSLLKLDAQSEHAKELRQLQHELDVVRDAKKPTTLRPERYDLDESDRMSMKSELDALNDWRKKNSGAKHDAEFDRRMQGIQKNYESRRKNRTPAAAPAPAGDFKAYYDSLPSGSTYTAPDGSKRIKR